MDIKEIVSKAAFIEERRRGAGDQGKGEVDQAEATAQSAERLKQWEQLLNVAEDDSIFLKRLKHDGITEEEALAVCGEYDIPEGMELPRWAGIITDIMDRLPMTMEEAEYSTSLCRQDLDLTGPVLSLFPFAMYCEGKLKSDHSALPMADLSGMVLKRLYQAVYQTFNTKAKFQMFIGHKFEDGLWEKIEKELLGGGWKKLFTEYPVLARRMGTVIKQYLGFHRGIFYSVLILISK